MRLKIPGVRIEPMHKEKWRELLILSKNEGKVFEEEVIKLDIDKKIDVSINLLPKITKYEAEEKRRKNKCRLSATKNGRAKGFWII